MIKLEDIKDIKIQVFRRIARLRRLWELGFRRRYKGEGYGNLYLGEDIKKKVMGTRI